MEYLQLLNADYSLKKNRAVQELLGRFKNALPHHFVQARFVTSSSSHLDHVIRADCKNQNCTVRAIVHVFRDGNGILKIREEGTSGAIQIKYDRTNQLCSNCKKLLKK